MQPHLLSESDCLCVCVTRIIVLALEEWKSTCRKLKVPNGEELLNLASN